ncbi:NUDIX hydrolase [Candidatus Bathyarchaeota archaeon]|nr:NUDIX hydrolase [Candidatus Bathyarchaeota archaeon]
MKREYPDRPVAGVGALIIKDGHVLLIKRGADPGKGRWSLPGGVVELGESVRDAVIREVKEECGLDVEVKDIADVVDYMSRDESGRVRFHYILIDFYVEVKGGTLKPASDALEVNWIPIDRVHEHQVTKTTLQLLDKVFQK